MPVSEQEVVLLKLQKLSEKDLVGRVVFPLLERFTFSSLELRHGIYEKGIDVLCIKKDELEDIELTAVQVKKIKFSGNASKSGHLYNVLNQLGQCLEEPIKLKDGTIRHADKVWLISPYILNISALEASFQKYINDRSRRIKIIDGIKLIELLYKTFPEILNELGDKFAAYTKSMEETILLMQEAPALRMKKNISLLPLYINLDLYLLNDTFMSVLDNDIGKNNIQNLKVDLKPDDLNIWIEYNSFIKSFFYIEPIQYDRTKIKQQDRDKNETYTSIKDFIKNKNKNKKKYSRVNEPPLELHMQCPVRAGKFLNVVKDESNDKIRALKMSMDSSGITSGRALKDFHDYITKVDTVFSHEITQRIVASIARKDSGLTEIDRVNVDIESLLESRLNLQVIGPAGSGKTTLLRMMAYRVIKGGAARIPVLVSLSNITRKDLIAGSIYLSCNSVGYPGSRESLNEMLNNGSVVLLLDGLDEAFSRVRDIRERIIEFIAEYPKVQCIFTTRPWSALERNKRFLSVKLLPFTKEQVELFFKNWFISEQSSYKEIIYHLKRNKSLYEIISTPLVATIFAVVQSSGGKLPTSLVELYEERFRLLLHDWDAVKGVKRDVFKIKDKYFFLRKLAFELHSQGSRSVNLRELLEMVTSKIGEISSRNEAEEFVMELLKNNNVLFLDSYGQWSLGHLRYQEYLAALEARENQKINLAEQVGDGWWSSVVDMYAEMTTDITDIAEYIVENLDSRGLQNDPVLLQRLSELISKAPNTESKVKNIINREFEFYNATRESFSQYSDSDVLHGRRRPRI